MKGKTPRHVILQIYSTDKTLQNIPIFSISEPYGKAEASEDSSGDEAETSPDKNGSVNSDKEDKEARKERKRLKRESKEKRREERRKKKLLKNQDILFKMVEGL